MGLVSVCPSMPVFVFWGSNSCILFPRWGGVRNVRTKANQCEVPSWCHSNGGVHARCKTDKTLRGGTHKLVGWSERCWCDSLKGNCIDFCPVLIFLDLVYSLNGLDVNVLTQARLHLSGLFACIKTHLSCKQWCCSSRSHPKQMHSDRRCGFSKLFTHVNPSHKPMSSEWKEVENACINFTVVVVVLEGSV